MASESGSSRKSILVSSIQFIEDLLLGAAGFGKVDLSVLLSAVGQILPELRVGVDQRRIIRERNVGPLDLVECVQDGLLTHHAQFQHPGVVVHQTAFDQGSVGDDQRGIDFPRIGGHFDGQSGNGARSIRELNCSM